MELIKVDIVSTELVDGEVRCTVGQGGEGTVADVTIWGNGGFISRPGDPADEAFCQGLYLEGGNTRRVIATKDNRIIAKYGELKPGDSAIVTAGPARVLVKDTDKSVTLLTMADDSDQNPVFVQVDGASGKVEIMCTGSNGSKVSKATFSPSAIFMGLSGGGSITIDMTGVTIGGSHFACNTKGGNFGLVGPAPPPTGAMSLLAGPTGMAGMPAALWTIATT